jgi:hypothetical protein
MRDITLKRSFLFSLFEHNFQMAINVHAYVHVVNVDLDIHTHIHTHPGWGTRNSWNLNFFIVFRKFNYGNMVIFGNERAFWVTCGLRS